MTAAMILAAVVVTLAAAARSTWSPCGLSMLASITPLAERGRGHRFVATATWFVAGAVAGGATLGGCMAGLAAGFRAISLTRSETLAVALAASVVAVASDVGFCGFRLPVHHRQVNERWLDRFRPWVYGAGFGWQIGSGLVTYIMTAAVYLMMVLSALVGEPLLALGLGTLFGLGRGLAAYLGRRITSAETLREFHLWFQDLGRRVERATVGVQTAVAILFAWLLSPWVAGALAIVVVLRGGAAVAGAGAGAGRRLRRSGSKAGPVAPVPQEASDCQTREEMVLVVEIP